MMLAKGAAELNRTLPSRRREDSVVGLIANGCPDFAQDIAEEVPRQQDHLLTVQAKPSRGSKLES